MSSQRLIASLATIASRQENLVKVLDSLQQQTLPFAEIHVYCNDWEGPDTPGITVHQAPEGNLGDIGKLYGCGDGYNFLCDDDFVYPPDYSKRMKDAIDDSGRIVGVYGIRLPPKVKNYFDGRTIYHYSHGLKHGRPVHLLGSGLLAYHSDHFKLEREAIERPNMTDCYIGVMAQQQAIGMRCISRPSGWMKPLPSPQALFNRRGDGRLQTEIVNRVREWQFF